MLLISLLVILGPTVLVLIKLFILFVFEWVALLEVNVFFKALQGLEQVFEQHLCLGEGFFLKLGIVLFLVLVLDYASLQDLILVPNLLQEFLYVLRVQNL